MSGKNWEHDKNLKYRHTGTWILKDLCTPSHTKNVTVDTPLRRKIGPLFQPHTSLCVSRNPRWRSNFHHQKQEGKKLSISKKGFNQV